MLTQESTTMLYDALSKSGLKTTQHRRHVYDILLARRDHPTADEVYERAKKSMANISLATVYNCLEVLVASGLVKQVNMERESSRYCPNLAEHAHFHCKKSGRVYDIDLSPKISNSIREALPEGYDADCFEINYRGTSPN